MGISGSRRRQTVEQTSYENQTAALYTAKPYRRRLPLPLPPPVPPPSLPQRPCVIVVAMFDFEGTLPGDLAFRKGDQMVMNNADDDNPWIYARHLATGCQGYVPRNFVVEQSSDLELRPWFFAGCNRAQAERMLLPPGLQQGTFLIRKATDGHFALCVKLCVRDSMGQKSDVVRHYKIKQTDPDHYQAVYYFISVHLSFSTLDQLVEHYQNTESRLCCRLTAPCPRTRSVPPFRDMQIPRQNITLIKKLGAGMFGEVWLGRWRALEVAVKTIKGKSTDEQDFIDEAQTMWKLQRKLIHPKLVTLYAVCVDGPPWIISEYMNRGSLLEWLHKDKGQQLTFNLLIDFLAQIAEGMAYLEQQQFVHRDLRAANVLANEQFEVKIADFGLARQNDYNFGVDTKFPIRWTAPEAAHERQFTTKSDVWSFGVLIYEVLTYGHLPYPGMTGTEILSYVDRGGRLQRPECINASQYPDAMYSLQLECWNRKARNRPTFENLQSLLANYAVQSPSNYGDSA